MLAGILSMSDVIDDYGTAASDHYARYIVNPILTQNQTQRTLNRRYLLMHFVSLSAPTFLIIKTKSVEFYLAQFIEGCSVINLL